MDFSIELYITAGLQFLLFMTTFKGNQWRNIPESVLWLMAFLIVDLNQGTVIFGMLRQ